MMHVKRRYFPISGVTRDVPGTCSINRIWKRLSERRMEMLMEIFSPHSAGMQKTMTVRRFMVTHGARRLMM